MKLIFRKKRERQQTFSTMIREALAREDAEKKKGSPARGGFSVKGLILEHGA